MCVAWLCGQSTRLSLNFIIVNLIQRPSSSVALALGASNACIVIKISQHLVFDSNLIKAKENAIPCDIRLLIKFVVCHMMKREI